VSNETDDALLARYRAGDQEAFGELVIRYERALYNAALWIVRNAEDARDVTQEVFLKVAVRLEEYDPRYKFFSWIYRIAVNESLNLLRRSGREEELDEKVELPAGDSVNPEWRLGEAQKSRRIRHVLMSMSANDRMVLMLRHFSELSYEEIAGILELDEKTVKSRLYEARQRLRELLQDLRTNKTDEAIRTHSTDARGSGRRGDAGRGA
jgi:RNA polymerase sigma-70 factor, ECF subfamily